MTRRTIALATLLAANAVASLHPAYAGSAHWELMGFQDVDGKRSVFMPMSTEKFPDPLSCIKAALALPPPPPAKVVQGHTIIYGYTCTREES